MRTVAASGADIAGARRDIEWSLRSVPKAKTAANLTTECEARQQKCVRPFTSALSFHVALQNHASRQSRFQLQRSRGPRVARRNTEGRTGECAKFSLGRLGPGNAQNAA